MILFERVCMVLKLGHTGQGSGCKYIVSSEMWCLRRMEWRRSFGHIVWEVKCWMESRRTGISCIQKKDG